MKGMIPKNMATDTQTAKRLDQKIFNREKIIDDLININFSDIKLKTYDQIDYAKLPKSLAIIQDNYFKKREDKVCYKIFYPGEIVTLNAIENLSKMIFFCFSTDSKTKDVLTFSQPLKIKDIELPEFKKVLTTDTVLSLNNMNVFEIKSNLDTKDNVFPPCYIKGSGKISSDFVYKNPSNRIIIVAIH